MKRIYHFAIIIVAAIIASCATNHLYTPKVSLMLSPQTINKSVKFEKFIDLSPAKDKERTNSTISVTHKKKLVGELDTEVTKAISSDFEASKLFKEVGLNIKNPDFIIKGEIKKFKGLSKINNYTSITSLAELALITSGFAFDNPTLLYMGGALTLPTYTTAIPATNNDYEVEIVLYIYDKTDNLIGIYTGKDKKSTKENIYKNMYLETNIQTNKIFSEVVWQLREQILKDANKHIN